MNAWAFRIFAFLLAILFVGGTFYVTNAHEIPIKRDIAIAAAMLFAWFFLQPLLDKLKWLGRREESLWKLMARISQHQAVSMLLLFMMGTLLSAAVGSYILQDFSSSGDEISYRFQAKIFAQNKLSVTEPENAEFFSGNHIVFHEGRVFSKYPPGWSFLLSIGVRLGVESWVNPILGGFFLVGFFLWIRTLVSSQWAFWASTLWMITPFYIFNNASYFSHTACACFVVWSLWLLTRAGKTGDTVWYFAAGVMTSLAFLVRPSSTVLFLCLPMALSIFEAAKAKRFFSITTLLLSLLPGFALFLTYSYFQYGSLLTTGYTLYDPRSVGVSVTWGQAARALASIVQLITWTTPILFLSRFDDLRKKCSTSCKPLLIYLLGFICLFTVCHVLIDDPGNQYGPRYLFEGIVAIILVGVLLCRNAIESGRFKTPPIFFTLAILFCVLLPARLYLEHQRTVDRSRLQRLLRENGIHHALVFVGAGARDMPASGLLRNDPSFVGDVILARNLPQKNHLLKQQYPERAFYRYKREGDGKEPELRKLP